MLEEERSGGRPTLFTPELGRNICSRVELVGFEGVAAEAVGIHRQTVASWRKRGEAGEKPYVDFARELAVAKASFIEKQLERVDDARWVLERLDREQFSAPSRHELTGKNGGAVTVTHKHSHSLSNEQAVSIVSKILGVSPALVANKFRPASSEADDEDDEAAISSALPAVLDG